MSGTAVLGVEHSTSPLTPVNLNRMWFIRSGDTIQAYLTGLLDLVRVQRVSLFCNSRIV